MNMKNILIKGLLIILIINLSSCDRPQCNNKNPIFENNLPDSKIYKDELVNQLNKIDQSQLSFWLQKYDNTNQIETLYFHIQSNELCAILHLNIKDWDKLEDVRKRKGIGRRGAEFTNLKFDVIKDSVSTKFIYKTYDRLID